MRSSMYVHELASGVGTLEWSIEGGRHEQVQLTVRCHCHGPQLKRTQAQTTRRDSRVRHPGRLVVVSSRGRTLYLGTLRASDKLQYKNLLDLYSTPSLPPAVPR